MKEYECEECAYYSSFDNNSNWGSCYATPPVLSNSDLSTDIRGWDDPIVYGFRPCCRFFKEKEKK